MVDVETIVWGANLQDELLMRSFSALFGMANGRRVMARELWNMEGGTR